MTLRTGSETRIAHRGRFSRDSWALLLAAAAVGVVLVWYSLHRTQFVGDESYRLFFAERPVVKLGNRIWLPFLQVQIWLYYLLSLPVEGIRLLGTTYLILGLAALGLYWRRVLDGNRWANGIAILALLSFARQRLTVTGGDLMQEPVGFGLLFPLAWLAIGKEKLPWIALPVGVAALLNRDTTWIYLLALTAVDLRRLPWDPRHWGRRRLIFYGVLWATPAFWIFVCVPLIYLLAYQRLPVPGLEWPLGHNQDQIYNFGNSAASLATGLIQSRSLFVAGGLMVAAFTLWFWLGKPLLSLFDDLPQASTILRATPVAIVVTYLLILGLDPWQATPGNALLGWPLIEVGFLAAPLLIRAAWRGPFVIRGIVGFSIAAGLLGGVTLGNPLGTLAQNAAIAAERGRLKAFLDESTSGQGAHVCLKAESRWEVFQEVGPPTFYYDQTYLPADTPVPEDCRFLILRAGLLESQDETRTVPLIPPGEFLLRMGVQDWINRWNVYERTPAQTR